MSEIKEGALVKVWTPNKLVLDRGMLSMVKNIVLERNGESNAADELKLSWRESLDVVTLYSDREFCKLDDLVSCANKLERVEV